MNKEEAIKKYKNFLPDDVEAIMLTRDDYDRQLGQLQFENIILKDRIDKAIEYIKENADDNCSLNFAEELLDILKGSDK